MRRRMVLILAIVVAASSLLAFECPAIASGPVVEVQTYGASYGEFSARWWQWVFSIPDEVNPLTDTTGEHCGEGQYDDVWFLAGTLGGTVERDCTIPAGKPIFFPLINNVYAKPFGYETLLDLRRGAAEWIDALTSLSCTIDAIPCFEDPSKFRVRSPSFTVIARAKRIQKPGILRVPGNTDSLVSDGYWLLLDPLSPGSHVIRFSAATSNNFSLDVTYHLTVQE